MLPISLCAFLTKNSLDDLSVPVVGIAVLDFNGILLMCYPKTEQV